MNEPAWADRRPGEALFVVESVSFAYEHEKNQVLRDVSLRLHPGRFYGLIGPNGCGKTTLVDLLSGCKEAATGTIFLDGRRIGAIGKRQLARRLALAPQEFDVGFGFTVEETVMMGRHPHIGRFQAAGPDDWAKARAAMAALGILDLAARSVGSLSGGQKQRVIVARALAQDTPALFLDEATANLDVRHALHIFNIVRRLTKEGRMALAVAHDLNLAAAFCDYLFCLKDGRLVAAGEPSAVLTAEIIREVFAAEAAVAWNAYSGALQVSYRYFADNYSGHCSGNCSPLA
ncbi:MAG: ABC transporter ATP-binding protein [Desulfobulbaceae bacterium]|jgi:iron complex transport system ATP-binding protein|nr:ABC transporter ATP-binding protein [Desulfobulbaceae bacterium]